MLLSDRVKWDRDPAVQKLREEVVEAVYKAGGVLTGRELAEVILAGRGISGGEAGAALAAAYRVLEGAAHRVRATFDRAFADALAAGDLPGTLPVEGVLDTAVVPAVGVGHRVLLVVLDGLSWAVANELLPDLRRQGWQEQTRLPSGDRPPPLLAAVPGVTEFSRAGLLCGRLTRGDAAEWAGFTAHPGLAAACDRKHPPVLFHKATATDGARGALSDDVRLAVLSEKARAVAVVVNAIDDELAGAEQVRGRWTLDAIRPLAALLQAARRRAAGGLGRGPRARLAPGPGRVPEGGRRRGAVAAGGRPARPRRSRGPGGRGCRTGEAGTP